MQAQNPSSSAVEASTPPNIKRYLVKETWKEYQVTLEVNHDVLTEETASLINGFWSNAEDRLSAENGDVVRTVILCEIQSDTAQPADHGAQPTFIHQSLRM